MSREDDTLHEIPVSCIRFKQAKGYFNVKVEDIEVIEEEYHDKESTRLIIYMKSGYKHTRTLGSELATNIVSIFLDYKDDVYIGVMDRFDRLLDRLDNLTVSVNQLEE